MRPFYSPSCSMEPTPRNCIRGSSRPTSSVVSFTLLDDLSNPMPDVPVDFRVNDTAGSGISVTSRALSDPTGTVTAVLSAGTQAGPVTVVATADPDGLFGGPVTVESAPVAITGEFPTSHIPIFCARPRRPFLRGRRRSVAPSPWPIGLRMSRREPTWSSSERRVATSHRLPPVRATHPPLFTTGEPGASVASVLSYNGDSWSYGALIPTLDVVEDATPRLYDNGTLTGAL